LRGVDPAAAALRERPADARPRRVVLAVDAPSPLAKNVAAMPFPPRARRALALAAACGLALAAHAARAEEDAPAGAPPTIYKWVDANGIAHYTTDLGRVPRSVRGSVRALGGGGTSPGDGFASRDASPDAPLEAPATPPAEWDQGGAAAAASASAPPADGAESASPAAAAGSTAGDEGFATSDRPAESPDGEGTAPASAGGAVQTASAADPARAGDLDARIASLEAEIASDEETLKGLLAAPAPSDPGEIAYDQSFRAVAERLPKRLAELRTLQSERAQLGEP
jgi:hypothetical protein